MTLSTGTLNLKFMQRAAARQSAAAPSTPQASTSTPQSKSTTATVSTSTPLSNSTSSAPNQHQTPNASSSSREEDTQWHIPRSTPIPVEVELGHRFESSYLPFLSGGGGRMAFGGFGSEETKPKDDEEDIVKPGRDEVEEAREVVNNLYGDAPARRRYESANGRPDEFGGRLLRGNGYDQRQPQTGYRYETDVQVRTAADFRIDKASSSSRPASPAPPSPRTFQRPAGFSPPPSSRPTKSHQSNTPNESRKGKSRLIETDAGEKRISLADKLRKTISSQRSAHGNTEHTPSPVTGDEDSGTKKGKKRKAADSDSSTPGKKSTTSPLGKEKVKGIPLNLDAREEELRAQKKKDKKAKRKASRGEGE